MNDDLFDRGPTDCEQETKFDPFTIDDPYNFRQSCYPLEQYYGFNEIIVDYDERDSVGNPTPMLIVKESTHEAKWNKKLTSKMRGLTRLIYAEMDHDGFQGTLITTVFSVVDSLYVVKVFECGKNYSFYIPNEFKQTGRDPSYEIECISAKCPSYIKFDEENQINA